VPLAEASICLAHMASHDNDLFEAELRRINEYGVIDARGLSLTADLLDRILAAARNSRGHTVLRDARFDRATFDCVARFNELTFEGEANFGAAVFKYGVQFYGTNFKSIVRFQDATFHFESLFEEAVFNNALLFHGVEFQRASFRRTTLKRLAGFFWARFKGLVTFNQATFEGSARFEGSRFGNNAWFKKTAFQDEAEFLGSTFGSAAHFKEATFWGSAGFSTCIFEGDADFTGTTFRGRVSLTPEFTVMRDSTRSSLCMGVVLDRCSLASSSALEMRFSRGGCNWRLLRGHYIWGVPSFSAAPKSESAGPPSGWRMPASLPPPFLQVFLPSLVGMRGCSNPNGNPWRRIHDLNRGDRGS
jgi:hypothetical protein